MDAEHNKRSGLDRRSGNDRRKEISRAGLGSQRSQHSCAERRESHEIRTGWVKVSKYSSVYLGVSAKKLK